ncbi:MAG: V-type ATP synthase subunit E [Nitrososphaerales archaeon]
MDPDPALERTITKVLSEAEDDMISQADSAYEQAVNKLRSSRGELEADYSRIIEGAKKQAENLKRQMIGNSRLAARNRQLVLIEGAVSDAFEKSRSRVESVRSTTKYASMLRRLLEESLKAVGDDAVVECNDKDKSAVKKLLPELERSLKIKIKVSEKPISCLGGVRVRSGDGSMVYENTLDSRIERLKPLIKKDIAKTFMR